jgi:thioredoxin 1
LSGTLPALGTTSFDAALADESKLVIVDFWADWCSPCHAMTPALEAFAAANADVTAVYTVDTVAHPELAERFAVMSLPTLLLFRDAELVHRTTGVKRLPQLEKLAEQHGVA